MAKSASQVVFVDGTITPMRLRTLMVRPSCATIYATRDMTAIAILGEYSATFAPHRATTAAIAHARARLRLPLDTACLSTRARREPLRALFRPVGVPPHRPYKHLALALCALRAAR